MKVVLIPIKDPGVAKERLSARLSSGERKALTWAMVRDVAAALNGATHPDRLVVTTASPEVSRYARQQGWDVIRERRSVSESHSVDQASRRLMEQGARSVLRLPADIPLLQSVDVDSLLEQRPEPGSAILVPSRDGTGTNALLRTPPDAFPSRFGNHSFLHHRSEAARRGIQVRVVENARIALDLDTPADLLCFQQLGTRTRTAQLLSQWESLRSTNSRRDGA